MRGFVFHGPGQSAWEEIPDPDVKEPTDAVVRVDAVTICGTDLHILKGDVPEVRPGTVLGHEAVGEIMEVGSDVRTVRPGDRVLVSCISACGRCRYCRESAYGQCRGGGGWILGHLIDGTQAEYVRVPYADLSVHVLPGAVESKDAVLLADIFPTSYEVGVLNGRVRPGTPSPSSEPDPSASRRLPRHACSHPSGSSPSIWPHPGWRPPSGSEPMQWPTPVRTPSS